MSMPDVQSRNDDRGVDIAEVGICNLQYPMVVETRDGLEAQGTVGSFSMAVSLASTVRGTHMSRFVEVLRENHHEPLSAEDLKQVAKALRSRLDAREARIEVFFPYFIPVQAPVSKEQSLLQVQAGFVAHAGRATIVKVEIPCTTLCPCSKEISENGAHSQRSIVSIHITTRGTERVWFEDLYEMVAKASSSPVYPLLKRPDEKSVTESAYNNPKFVEDIVRDLTLLLRDDERVAEFRVRSTNQESIHAHDAYALVVGHTQTLFDELETK